MSKTNNAVVLTIAQQSALATLESTTNGHQSRVSFKTWLEHKNDGRY